ncbi:MAG: NepR family anti-sigma factor [Pseudomonadota bacterium]
MDSENDASKPKPVLEAKVQAELGKKLQQVYSDIISEPVPDRFLNLLEQLEESSNSDKSSE